MNDKEYENIFFFKNNDLGFIEFIIKNRGYVYNDFGGNKVDNFSCLRSTAFYESSARMGTYLV